jgi:hypothetical protein
MLKPTRRQKASTGKSSGIASELIRSILNDEAQEERICRLEAMIIVRE